MLCLAQSIRRINVAEKERLLRVVENLRKALEADWDKIEMGNLSLADKKALIKQSKWCVLRLNTIILKLEQSKAMNDA